MGLGRRNARQHETVGFQKNALGSSVFWEFRPQQQVMTVDGVPGVVTAVLDGPYPGTEEYEVTLDNGMGGGSYTASQLQPLANTTASHDHEATGLHTADQDYPELGSILHDRPPLERMTFSAARGDNPFEIRHEEVNTGGIKFPKRVDMTAHHPETGEQVGKARYFPPKRKGGPVSIDEVKGDAPGAASALLDEIESRHPGSRTHFMYEVKRNNNNPDVTGHENEDFGKPSDWDTHYPNVADTIHRGVALKLPPYSARVVNSPGNTKDEHLAEIHSAMPEGPNVGTHWTENEHSAQLFAHNAVSDYRTTIPVVLHAQKPTLKDIETRQPHLYRGGVLPYGNGYAKENEIPVRRGREVKVTGISWKPDAPHPDADESGWIHHTYDEPMHHTAAMEDVEDEGTQEAEPELPPCAYCGSDQMQIAGDNGRAQQAKCQVCGGMMSAPYGLQFKPELIGDPSNHPKDDPDPASGGVPGAANMRVPVKRMNDSDYTASLHEAGRYEYSSPTGWHYDTSINGKVTMTSPEGESHDVWTHGMGIKQFRHPDDMPTPLYHGTRREIPEGEQIEPGHPGNFVKRMKHVYMADDPEEAANYAGPYGHVYQVKPTGLYGHRSDAKGANWATEHPVDIVGVHRGPTHHPGEDGKPVRIEGALQHTAKTVSWDEIGDMHPHVYGDAEIHGEDADGADGPGIGEAANFLAHERPGHQDAEDSSVHDLEFHPMKVHPRHIDFSPSGMDNQRVKNAFQGYKSSPNSVPPLVLVKRHNVYQVADGHHRAEAAAYLNSPVRAYVAHSPYPDEPFADGRKGPFYGAEPLPKEMQDENNLHAHMQNEHGYAEDQLSGKSDKDIARYHDQKHFDCPAEFRAKMGSLRVQSEEDASYRMQHQAPDADYGAPLHDVENMMPGFYEHPEWYNHGQEHLHESTSVIHGARGNPEKKVKIYRALPAEHAGKGFNTGDWVSTSKSYARDHARVHSDSKHDWPVISTTVPAKHLHTEGDVHEWAYNGPGSPATGVAFKGGYHQEVRQRPDGSISPVQRKANPFKERAESLKEKGYSFSHYRPRNGDPNHTVTAYDHQDNWAGMVKAHENGEVHHVEIDPEHAHEPLEEHMRDMIARETKKTGSLHEAGERDWCTFRHNARCFYPGPLNAEGVRLGTPQDRGPCAWDYWQQQVCPISEPGPMALMQAKGSKIDELQDPDFKFHFTASWSDVRAKARRIRSEGQVNITVATNEGVGGEVKGDHHVYETVLTYVPGTYKVGSWECGCKWAAYAWGRSPAYRRFEGRMCSHALAMQFEAQAKGMFGRTVEPSTERPKWLRHHTPVVTQYERDSGENLTRRAVPPGNMRRTYEGALDVEGIYSDDHGLDLVHPPVYAYVVAELQDPVDAMKFMAALGMSHSAARAVVKDATAERATGELHFEASLRLLAEEGEHKENEKKRCPDCGSMISVNDEKCPHCHHVFSEHEHHHGAKTPGEGDLMSRGMVIGGDWDRDAVHRMMNGNATAHDLLHHIDKSDVGDFWYPHEPHLSPESNISGAKDFAQAESSDHPAEDLDRQHPIGEVGVVLVGHKPHGWDPESNPDHGLMGNSYIPHSADVPLHQIHYHDHNGNWHSADATGHSVHVHGGGYDRDDSAIHQGAKTPEYPTVAGVALKAADTGRILMLQRGLDDEKDPARGTWEIPGGHLEDGDQTSLHGAIREWEEETGQPFPEGGVVHHTWTSPNGIYQGHVVVIPEERAVEFHNGRQVVNPDNPDGDCHEQAAWWDVDHARKNPALREELKTGTPWKEIKAAGNTKTAATADPLYGLEEASPMSPPQHSRSQNPASTGWATAQDPHSWDDPEENSTNFGAQPADGYLGSLHDEPEPALPSTDGAESELDDQRDNADPSQYDENDAELTPNTTLASAGGAADIVARFQATAAATALGGGEGTGGGRHTAQQANNKDIANAAKEFLTKRALKDFNFREQQELINEGDRDKAMARNSDVLNIDGTHYSALEAALAAEEALEDSAELFV